MERINSWSRPQDLPDLIGRKHVDWSLFENGTTIPRGFHERFSHANNEVLTGGDRRDVTLLVDGEEHAAVLSMDDRPDTQNRLQLRYDSNQALKQLLRERFQTSYNYFRQERAARASEAARQKIFLRTDADKAEYLDFFATDRPYRYRLEYRTRSTLSWTPPDFEQVWADLEELIGDGRTVHTLSRKAPNRLRWLGDSIAVTTDRSTDPLPRSMFEEAWEALAEEGIVFADRMPGSSRYRNAAVSAILAMLPYVDYTLHPRIRLFLTGHRFSDDQLTQVMGAQGEGSVRWAGPSDKPKTMAVVADPETLTVTTNHHLAGQALYACEASGQCVYAFTEADDGYRYLGRYQVETVREGGAGYIATIKPHDETEPLPPPAPEPIRDLAAITAQFSAALQASHIHFGPRHEERVRAFIAALATKRLVILTGLSGSGKTQIALRFGQWLGRDRYKIIPVRPDWTGSEALFGYPDALGKAADDGRQAWQVPGALAFMLQAARDPAYPYLLVLDEMNLAHVERYFADVLSGMESGERCLPNLQFEDDGRWRLAPGEPEQIPFPPNLFVVGTVNVDETTYMFSPKVLDRANTFEFRVETDDLTTNARKPVDCQPGAPEYVRGFLALAGDDQWQADHPADGLDRFTDHLRTVHRLLAEGGFEFGHRVFYEAVRFAAMLQGAGNTDIVHALDLQIMQKVLPRLHGTRRRLEPTLCALSRFCADLTFDSGTIEDGTATKFNPLAQAPGSGSLPRSLEKIRRMTRSLRANQFTSFTE